MARSVTPTGQWLLVADQRRGQILLIEDLDGDGISASLGETTVFFYVNNASGLDMPSTNSYSVTQMADRSVFTTDGNSDTVYRLMGLNGDAQDLGEAQVLLSPENAAGASLVTPQDVAKGADGAYYVTNAGTGSAPQDALYRIEDVNDDNVIDPATEVVNFITDDMNFDAPVDLTNSVDGSGSVYTLTWFPSGDDQPKIYRLTDLNGSNTIDDAAEAVEVWNSDALP